MAKTASMKLIELMILKEDIDSVLEFLGKKGNFQFQNLPKENIHNTQNPSGEIFQKILEIKTFIASMGVSVSTVIASRAACTCWARRSSIFI